MRGMPISEGREREVTIEDMRRAWVPKRFWHVSFENIPDSADHKKILANCIEKTKGFLEKGYGVLLYGSYGEGKTASAIILAKEALARNALVLMIPVTEVSGLVIKGQLFDEDETVEERMKSVDLLVLDDLGGEGERDWGIIERIVRYRSNWQKSTIITTNCSLKTLRGRYGVNLWGVIEGCIYPVRVKGPNWREKEKNDIGKFLE